MQQQGIEMFEMNVLEEKQDGTLLKGKAMVKWMVRVLFEDNLM